MQCRGVFTQDYKKTIGVDFLEKVQYVPSLGEDVHMFLWDTAGQEEFDSITKTYYRGRRNPQSTSHALKFTSKCCIDVLCIEPLTACQC